MGKAGIITDYMRSQGSQAIIEVRHNASCNVMYRKDIFLAEGGFLGELWPGEDVELDYRLSQKGYKHYFNPRAVVYHYRPAGIASFSKMMFRYGWAQGFLVKKYGIFRKTQFLPLVSIAGVVLFLLLLFMSRTAAAGMALFILGGLIVVSGFDPVVFLLLVTATANWHLGFVRGYMGYRR
jgi:GT2 family glycosyltransferase